MTQRVVIDLSERRDEETGELLPPEVSVVDMTAQEVADHQASVPGPTIVYAGEAMMTGRVRTTDATPTEIYRATLRQVTGYRAIATLLGVDAGNGAVRQITASIVAKRLNNGAALVGTPVVVANHTDAAASTWATTASVSGNDFVITVTGAAGRTIDWLLDGRTVSFTPSGA